MSHLTNHQEENRHHFFYLFFWNEQHSMSAFSWLTHSVNFFWYPIQHEFNLHESTQENYDFTNPKKHFCTLFQLIEGVPKYFILVLAPFDDDFFLLLLFSTLRTVETKQLYKAVTVV